MCIDTFPEIEIDAFAIPERTIIHGEVHDGNCYYMGGAAGHAGFIFRFWKKLRNVGSTVPGGPFALLSSEICTTVYKKLHSDPKSRQVACFSDSVNTGLFRGSGYLTAKHWASRFHGDFSMD